MRVGFISPTFHTLAPTWRRDPQIVKLAAPQIAGALFANGYTALRQYDFEVEIYELERNHPGKLDLRVFFDEAKIDAFLADDEPSIRAQGNLILDQFDMEEADLFALSCASVLEIYADMHAVGNLNLCLTKLLKERYPKCRTVIGGLKISPDSKHQAEYRGMLDRCPTLDYAADNRGEAPLLAIVESLTTGKSLAELGEKTEKRRFGEFILAGSKREVRLSPVIAREEGIAVARGYAQVGLDSILVNGAVPDAEPVAPKALVQLSPLAAKLGAPVGKRDEQDGKAEEFPGLTALAAPDKATPETGFGPQGEHERKPIFNPSIMMTPWFDPKNIEKRKLSGHELCERYHLGPEWRQKLAGHMDDQVAILPSIFMEGCNARCAFCAYSMTKMVTRDVKEVVRALGWLADKHGVRNFHFLNTNINGSMKYAEAFVDELIAAKIDIQWSDCANLWALNPKLLEKMVKSGCIRFTFGLECPSDRMLDYIGKGINVQQAHERLKLASDLGIWNHLLLITGLPTETEEDQKHFVDFLEKSKDYSDAYSISAFYLIGSSLMGAFPHRYNIEMMPNPSGLLEDQGFNEVGGLTWERKKRQIVRSTETITDAIRRIKVDPKYWSGAIDLELLFHLYKSLGHDNKKDIVRCYEDAYLGAPAHAKSYRPDLEKLLSKPGPAAEAMMKGGLRARPEQIEIRGDTLVLPVESTRDAGKVEVELYCLAQTKKPLLVSGENLGASAAYDMSFAEALRPLVAEGSEFEKAVEKAGWKLSDRNITREAGALGVRLELAGRAVDVFVRTVTAASKALVSKGNLGISYSVPSGFQDPTRDARVIPFISALGKFLLDRLATDPRAAAASAIDIEAVRELASTLIHELEATRIEEIRLEPIHKHANVGKRHRDQYSKVVAPEKQPVSA